MRADEIKPALQKRSAKGGLSFRLGAPATETDFAAAERLFRKPLPPGVRHFYSAVDGLVVESPPIEILPLSRLRPRAPQTALVDFAVVDEAHILSFDTAERNKADEWTIVCVNQGSSITLTMASFWSNKLFAWIDHRKPIWLPSRRERA